MYRRLEVFWEFLETAGERVDMKQLGSWPIVAASTGSKRCLMSIDGAVQAGVVCRKNFSQDVVAVLEAFGFRPATAATAATAVTGATIP